MDDNSRIFQTQRGSGSERHKQRDGVAEDHLVRVQQEFEATQRRKGRQCERLAESELKGFEGGSTRRDEPVTSGVEGDVDV